MQYDILVKELIGDEGLKLRVYKCSEGKDTIGVGRCLETKGLTLFERWYLGFYEFKYTNLVLTKEQAMFLLFNDIHDSYEDLLNIFGSFNRMVPEVQHILINLMHQLGRKKFLGFKKMVQAVKVNDWNKAAVELRDSLMWRKQTQNDTERLAKRFEALA